jgi:hypothetical protein
MDDEQSETGPQSEPNAPTPILISTQTIWQSIPFADDEQDESQAVTE